MPAAVPSLRQVSVPLVPLLAEKYNVPLTSVRLAGFEPVDAGSHGVHFKSSGPAIRLGPGQTTVTGWARLDQETEVQVELLTPSK